MAEQKEGRRSVWPVVVFALALAAVVMSAFAISMLQRETLQLRERVDTLEAELEALEDEVGQGGHGGSALQLEPTIQFALMAFLEGYVGVGGEIDGSVNPVLSVRPGDVVRITVINGEDIEHDLVIDELGVHSEHLSTEGAEDEVEFIAPAQGSFYYFCSVPGHRDRGMEGTLEVVA